MASKKVYLRRKQLDNYLPEEVRAESVLKLSSVFVNRQPLKGFDYEDEKKYLKGILDVDPDNQSWPKYAKEFWTNMTIKVGFEGVELEIGKDDNGEPLQIMDFIQYNFIDGNSTNKEFYEERLEALRNFKSALQQINREYPWYWQSVSGVEALLKYNPEDGWRGGDDANLKIECL